MLAKLKNNSIEKAYHKHLINVTDRNQNAKKIKTVAILLDNESLRNVVRANLLNKLPLQRENITILSYHKVAKKEEVPPNTFSEDDFGYKGSLKSDILQNFVKNEFDLLINYTKEANLFIDMVTLLSKATLKVGFANIEDKLYDIVIADETLNEEVLNKELKKYLTILNKI